MRIPSLTVIAVAVFTLTISATVRADDDFGFPARPNVKIDFTSLMFRPTDPSVVIDQWRTFSEWDRCLYISAGGAGSNSPLTLEQRAELYLGEESQYVRDYFIESITKSRAWDRLSAETIQRIYERLETSVSTTTAVAALYSAPRVPDDIYGRILLQALLPKSRASTPQFIVLHHPGAREKLHEAVRAHIRKLRYLSRQSAFAEALLSVNEQNAAGRVFKLFDGELEQQLIRLADFDDLEDCENLLRN